MQALKSEGASRAVANEPFDPDPVVALDPHGGIDAEPAARLPAEHVSSDILLEEFALQKRPEHTLLHGALETAPVLRRQSTRLVKLHSAGAAGHDLPDGHLAVARPGAWEIEIIELDTGTPARRHQRAVAPLPLSDEQWEAQPQIREIRAIERERGPVHGQGGTACPILDERPRFFPVIRTLVADETGRLWVEATSADGFSLTIIDAEGRPVGESAMPRRDPRVTPYVRGNILYLVTVDDMDVQSIEVYEARFVGQLQDRS